MATLESLIGAVPANFNIAPWALGWTNTDFTDSDKFGVTRSTISQLTSPLALDGTETTQKLVETSSSGTHLIQTSILGNRYTLQISNCGNGIEHTIAFVAKAAERSRLYVTYQHLDSGGGPDASGFASLGFDLAGGQTYGASAVGMANVTSSMDALSDGWYLCKMVFTNDLDWVTISTVSITYSIMLNLDNGSGTAAKSTSYAGNGSSGVYLWWLNMLPTCAWTTKWYTTFQDDFTNISTVDVNNIKDPGFKWYANNYWPNSPLVAPWVSRKNLHTPADAFSISSPSVLELNNPNPSTTGGVGTQIMTACPTGMLSDGYMGYAPQPPMIWDVFWSYDSLAADYNTNWDNGQNPAIWSTGIEVLTDNPPTNSVWVEYDVHEQVLYVSPPPNDSYHTFMIHAHRPDIGQEHDYGGFYDQVFNPGEFHRTSTIWLSTSITQTSYGLIMYFMDGCYVQASDLVYSADTVPQRNAGGGSPGTVGDVFLGESTHYPIMIDAGENTSANPGGGWAVFIDWVKVYTPNLPPAAKGGLF